MLLMRVTCLPRMAAGEQRLEQLQLQLRPSGFRTFSFSSFC